MAIFFFFVVDENTFTFELSPNFSFTKRLFMKFKITLLVLSILFGSFLQVAIAQNLSVTGKVKSKANGDPLIGTTVSSKGTTNSVITDANGNFSITVQKGATLVFTYTGMALIE